MVGCKRSRKVKNEMRQTSRQTPISRQVIRAREKSDNEYTRPFFLYLIGFGSFWFLIINGMIINEWRSH